MLKLKPRPKKIFAREGSGSGRSVDKTGRLGAGELLQKPALCTWGNMAYDLLFLNIIVQ